MPARFGLFIHTLDDVRQAKQNDWAAVIPFVPHPGIHYVDESLDPRAPSQLSGVNSLTNTLYRCTESPGTLESSGAADVLLLNGKKTDLYGHRPVDIA